MCAFRRLHFHWSTVLWFLALFLPVGWLEAAGINVGEWLVNLIGVSLLFAYSIAELLTDVAVCTFKKCVLRTPFLAGVFLRFSVVVITLIAFVVDWVARYHITEAKSALPGLMLGKIVGGLFFFYYTFRMLGHWAKAGAPIPTVLVRVLIVMQGKIDSIFYEGAEYEEALKKYDMHLGSDSPIIEQPK